MARAQRITPAKIAALVEPARGNLAVVAQRLGCSRRAVYDALAGSEDLQLRIYHVRESRVDRAEDALDAALDAGERWAVLEVLHSTPGRRRGWGGGDPELEQKLADLEQALAQLQGSEGDAIDYRSL